MNAKALKKQLMAAIAMVVVAAVALSSATYAWFVNNTRVDAKTATLNASTANALYISQGAVGDSTGWTTTHSFASANATNDHILPVSTTGKTSVKIDAEASNQTETPMTFVKSNAWEINSGNSNKNEVKTYAAATANTEYFMDNFEIKASQACKLAIDMDATTMTASDAVKAVMRLALVVTNSDGSNPKYFFYTLDNGTALTGGMNTTFNGSEGADGIAKAIKNGNKEKAEAVDVISADNLDGGKVKQITGISGASSTALNTMAGDTLYEFTTPNEVCKVTAYIWMEGCDYDTIGANLTSITGASNKLVMNLGFCAAN